MRISIDLVSGKAVLGRGTTQEIATLREKRATVAVLEAEFVRNVTVQELDASATGKFELKIPTRYDNPQAITGASSWTKIGTGTSTYYRFAYALINDALDYLFGVSAPVVFTAVVATDLLSAAASPAIGSIIEVSSDDTLPGGLHPGQDLYVITAGHTATDWKVSLTPEGTPINIASTGTGTHKFALVSDDVTPVTLMGEISWREFALDHKTQTISFVIENDVNRDGDTIPGSPAVIYTRDSFIRHGSGVPDDSVGVDGDGYVNDDNGDLYFRDAGVYVLDFNLKGHDAGFTFKFNSATSGDPASGKFLFNNATFASATQLNISETDDNSNSLASFLAQQDDSTSGKKTFVLARKAASTAYFSFWITSALTDAGTYNTFPIQPISTAGSISNGDPLQLVFIRTGDKGDAGGQFVQNYSSTTADADPGSGIFRLNNATIASVTGAYLDNSEAGGNAINAFLDTFDDSTATIKGILSLRGVTNPLAFAVYAVTGSVVDGTGYRKLSLTHIASGGVFTTGDLFAFTFVRNGDSGTAGATPAITQNYSTTTTDSDPGSGIFRFNNATIASVTAAYLDNNESGGGSITGWLDTFDDSNSAIRGILIFKGITSPTAFAVFSVTGSVVDGSGYRKLTLTYLSSGGTFTNAEMFALAFYRAGDIDSTAPQNAKNVDYTLALTDAGKHIFHDSATPHTWTIPANGSVAFPIGTIITLVNNTGGGDITLVITTDTLRRGDGTAGTGSRTITADSIATILKTKTQEWLLGGVFT